MAEDPDDDLDRVDGQSGLGWLILTGAATVVGVMPWTAVLAARRFFGPHPGDLVAQMVEDWALPTAIGAVASGIGALAVVCAARAGRPLPGPAVLALGAVIGAGVAWLRAYGGMALAFGAACGLAGAAAALFIRARHLRGGSR